MEKEFLDKKTRNLHLGVVFLVLFSFFGIALALYCHWKGRVDDTNGYNSINAIIAFIAMGINILTVIFVFITYQAQKETIRMQAKQIADDKKDGEFNRVLDIVYKQLEHTTVKYNTKTGSSWSTKVFFTEMSRLLTKEQFYLLVNPNSGVSHYFNKVFTSFFIKEFEVYYRVIMINNQLSNDDRIFFTHLFVNNVDNNIIKVVELFQELYYDFQQSEQYNIQKGEDLNSRFVNIEKDLKLVLQYLNLTKIEGLKLD